MSFSEKEWKKSPQYLSCIGSLFGGLPELLCCECKKPSHELFYGHCHPRASFKDIPIKVPKAEVFHEAVGSHSPVVVVTSDVKKRYPWWSWRRWFCINMPK